MSQMFTLVFIDLQIALWIVTLFQAQHVWLWKITLAFTESAQWFGLVDFLLLVRLAVVRPSKSLGSIFALSVVTLLNFLPTLSSLKIEAELKQQFNAEFKIPADTKHDWFKISNYLKGIWPQRTTSTIKTESEDWIIYRPKNISTPQPFVVVIHGGGWNSGKPQDLENLNYFLNHRNIAVVAIRYPLAPTHKWPSQRENLVRILKSIQDNHRSLELDPKRFALLGRSAGGQIAESACDQKLFPGLRACILFYSPTDLDFGYRVAEPHDLLESRQLIENYIGGTPDQLPLNYLSASPLNHLSKATAPTLQFHGPRDPLVWIQHSRRLRNRLTELQVSNLLVQLPFATHGFDYFLNGPNGQISSYIIQDFLKIFL